jgi:D-alanine-D-alanine ligase
MEALHQADICFPVMHGKEGEDGTLYQCLQASGKPFVGSDPSGAKIACDKILFKKYCNEKHIITADWSVITSREDIIRFGFPCVLKAANGGSSHEVALLFNEGDLESEKAKMILGLTDSFFIESYLKGIEITVGILVDTPLPVVEIVPPKDGWFDYEHKYSGKSREMAFAPSLSGEVQQQAQEIALKIHRDLGLKSFSRTDMIVVDNVPYVLEVNTPAGVGLTPQSLFPKAASAMGISFEQLVDRIINKTLEEFV